MVVVDVEYCGYCDFQSECENLARVVKLSSPNVDVRCHRGRKGSFEVKVDEVVVYSRLNTDQLPNFQDIARVVQDAFQGRGVEPIKTNANCSVM